jgi:hypothetical protein
MLLTIGLAIFALGLIGFIYGIFQRLKVGRVSGAPLVKTGEAAARGPAAAGQRGAVSAEGNVLCPQPLVAPVSGTPCLYYEIKCTARWKDGNAERQKEIARERVAAEFAIDDGSGPVRVEANQGGDFEPTQRKSETKGTGLLGGITGTDLEFGQYRVSTGALSLGTKYTVEETVLPLTPRLYVCGKATAHHSIGSPDWRQMLLSAKSRDELLGSASRGAKMFLAGGTAALALGATLATVGQLSSNDDKDVARKDAAPSAVAASPTAPAGGAGGAGTSAAAAAVASVPAGTTPAAVTAKPGKPGKRHPKK